MARKEPYMTTPNQMRDLQHDVITLAFRLMGENEDTMSPECREVMAHWRPKCLAAMARVAGKPDIWADCIGPANDNDRPSCLGGPER